MKYQQIFLGHIGIGSGILPFGCLILSRRLINVLCIYAILTFLTANLYRLAKYSEAISGDAAASQHKTVLCAIC